VRAKPRRVVNRPPDEVGCRPFSWWEDGRLAVGLRPTRRAARGARKPSPNWKLRCQRETRILFAADRSILRINRDRHAEAERGASPRRETAASAAW